MSTQQPVAVIGAGPAGLGAAWRLAQRQKRQVYVFERGAAIGGNAGSFCFHGMRVDYGSHRLHPSCDPEILKDIETLLEGDLISRPRHGRIRLKNRWVHFPLKPLDLVGHVPPAFALGVMTDLLTKRFLRKSDENFATVLQAGLGPTICSEFYFPYAKKIWGLPPQQLHSEQARRRVSASSVTKLMRKVLSTVPGVPKPPGAGKFFYPRKGFGQISEAYAAAARESGAKIIPEATVTGLERDSGEWRINWNSPSGPGSLCCSAVFSTIPMPALARLLAPPPEVTSAIRALRYRGMLLIYLLLETDQYTEFDAHYFPGGDIALTRVSEPKHYGLAPLPGQTVLCAELPCQPGDPVWEASDADLADLVINALGVAGLPRPERVADVQVKRLGQAYPIYTLDFFEHFETIDRFLGQIPGLLTFGRQGLFVHDNTHHALKMAYAAEECFVDGQFDRERWNDYRTQFANNVVED